ncbi:MAG: FAD/NAD(P)-binding protein [Nitrospirota bacterium]
MGDSIYLPRPAEIVEAKQVTTREKFFRLRLSDGSRLGHVPGQFVEVSILGIGESPISVCSSHTRKDNTFDLCIRNTGSVTGALHRLGKGAAVGIRGPFGRGFPIEDIMGQDLLFVAGGLGLVPLRSMITYALDNRQAFGSLALLYGSRSPEDMLFRDEMEEWGRAPDFKVDTTVDIGDSTWTGNVGVLPRLFNGLKVRPSNTVALVVGPPVMFRFIIKAVLSTGISESRTYISLERRMKCGVGKCGHCQMDNVYVCQKGPVFPYTKVRHLKEAF